MKYICLLCRSSRTELFTEKFNYHLRKCLNCGLIFLADPPSKKDLYEIYQEGYFTGDKKKKGYVDYEEDRDNLMENFSRWISIIKEYKRNGRLLDIGCATGVFLEVAQKEGFDAYGIDLSSYAVSLAQKKMPNKVYLSSLLDFSSKEKFDVVTMWDVIEHFLEPKKNLLKIHKLLKDDGLLVLITKNSQSLWAKIWGRSWYGYLPPQHVVCFSPKTIKRILSETGFEIIKIFSEGKLLSLRYIFHIGRSIVPNRATEKFYQFFDRARAGKRSIYLNLYDSLFVLSAKKHKSVDHLPIGKIK